MKGWQGEPFVGVARSRDSLKNSHIYIHFVFEFNYCSVFLSFSSLVRKCLVEMLHALLSKSNRGNFTRNKKRLKLVLQVMGLLLHVVSEKAKMCTMHVYI